MAHQTKKYLTSFVPSLTPDPSLNIPRDNNTATLRLYIQPDFSDRRLSIDYREKSPLAGIVAALGGFWTVANGIFTIIFGTTLSWFLLGEWLDRPYTRGVLTRTSGTKPLSAFGLIHKIPKFKPVLEDERKHGRYPNLLSDGQSDGGLLDYVHDHFVDLGPLESDQAGSTKSDPDVSFPLLPAQSEWVSKRRLTTFPYAIISWSSSLEHCLKWKSLQKAKSTREKKEEKRRALPQSSISLDFEPGRRPLSPTRSLQRRRREAIVQTWSENHVGQRIWDLETPASFTGGVDGGSTRRWHNH